MSLPSLKQLIPSGYNSDNMNSRPGSSQGSSCSNDEYSDPDSQQNVKQKRLRRKCSEVERIFLCGFNGCPKSYGTLNHLNTHIVAKNHGAKRRSEHFKKNHNLSSPTDVNYGLTTQLFNPHANFQSGVHLTQDQYHQHIVLNSGAGHNMNISSGNFHTNSHHPPGYHPMEYPAQNQYINPVGHGDFYNNSFYLENVNYGHVHDPNLSNKTYYR